MNVGRVSDFFKTQNRFGSGYGAAGGISAQRNASSTKPSAISEGLRNMSRSSSSSSSSGGAGSSSEILLSNGTRKEKKLTFTGTVKNTVIDSMKKQTDFVRGARQNAQKTSNSVTKLKYQYKDMSSRIIRSKTSNAAKQAASQARREMLRLKRLKNDEKYDTEDIDAAINHAKAMERVAKKKARHLEEEEMAKVGSACLGGREEEDIEEKVDDSERDDELTAEEEYSEDELAMDEYLSSGSISSEEFEASMEMISEMFSDFSEDMISEMSSEMFSEMMSDMTEEVLDDMSEAMKDMLADMGLDELSESLEAYKGDMDPNDLKMMKIKHRNKEMKDIVKADTEYLKAVFDKLEKAKAMAITGAGAGGMSVSSSPNMDPVAALSADVSSGGASGSFFDVSL